MTEPASEERLADILEAIPSGVTIIDTEGRITSANAAAERILGLRRSAIAGRAYDAPQWEITAVDGGKFPPEDLPVARVLRTGERVGDLRHAISRPDGSSVYLSIDAAPLHDEQGNLTGVIATLTDITASTAAEEALRENEARFRQLSDAAFEGIAIHEGGILLDANATFCKMFGYELHEVVGRSILPLATPESRDSVIEHIRSGSEEPYDAVGLRKDGTTFPGELRGLPITYQGRPARVVAMRDLTDRQAAEEDARRSRNLLEAVVEGTPDAVYVKDLEGRYIMMNTAASVMVGKRPEEVLGRDVTALLPPDEAEAVAERDRAVMDSGGVSTYEESVTLADGELHVFMSTKGPLQDEEGNVVGLFGFERDITERKELDEALRQSEFFFKESQRAAFIGSYKTDFTAGTWESSEVLDQIFGIDGDYVRSVEGWLDLVHPDDRETMDRYLREEVIAKRAPFDMEYRIVRRSDGEVRWVLGLGSVEFGPAGEILSMIGTIQDVTARKQAEERLRKTDADRRELLARLVVAQEDERKRIANDVHDDSIQVMVAAAMRASALRSRLDSPEVVTDLVRLEDTINLAVSRLRQLAFDLSPRVLEEGGLAAALREVLRDLDEDVARGFDDRLREEPRDEMRAILYRIAREAIVNVRKHADAKRVDVLLEQRDSGFAVRIADDGRGFVLGAAASPKGGIGLASMKERAELAGGWFELETAPGSGTVVEFWLPEDL